MVVTGLGLLLGGRADAGPCGRGPARAGSRAWSGSPTGPAGRRACRRGRGERRRRRAAARPHRVGRGPLACARGRRPSVPVGVARRARRADLVAVHGQSDQHRLLRPARQRDALDRFAGSRGRDPAGRLPGGSTPSCSTSSASWTRSRPQPASAPGGRPAAVRPGRDRGGRARGPARTVALAAEARAARPRRRPAHGRRVGPRGAARRPRGTTADALRRWSPRRGARSSGVRDHDPALGELADRLAEVAYLARRRRRRPRLLRRRRRRRPGPAGGGRGTPGRADARSTRKYGETAAEVLRLGRSVGRRGWPELDDADERIRRSWRERAAPARPAGPGSPARCPRRAPRPPRPVRGRRSRPSWPSWRCPTRCSTSLDVTPRRRRAAGRRPAAGVRPARGSTRSSCCWPPHTGTRAAPARQGRLGRRAVAGDARGRGGASPAPTRCRRSSSTRSTPASAAGPRSRSAGGWPRWPRTAQVLVVTHLPQVAAFADRHLVVEKSSDGSVTTFGAHRCSTRTGRVRELTADVRRARGVRVRRWPTPRELLAAAAGVAREHLTAGVAPSDGGTAGSIVRVRLCTRRRHRSVPC